MAFLLRWDTVLYQVCTSFLPNWDLQMALFLPLLFLGGELLFLWLLSWWYLYCCTGFVFFFSFCLFNHCILSLYSKSSTIPSHIYPTSSISHVIMMEINPSHFIHFLVLFIFPLLFDITWCTFTLGLRMLTVDALYSYVFILFFICCLKFAHDRVRYQFCAFPFKFVSDQYVIVSSSSSTCLQAGLRIIYTYIFSFHSSPSLDDFVCPCHSASDLSDYYFLDDSDLVFSAT